MMERIRPPYQYTLDTSALIDLKDQYPFEVFPGVWERFNEMCEQKLIVSPREVYQEICRGDDWLTDWAKQHAYIFIEPSEAEIELLQHIYTLYKSSIVEKYGTRSWADPMVVACAKYFNLPILQHEQFSSDRCTIPYIAGTFGIKCLRLPAFFSEEGWQFS